MIAQFKNSTPIAGWLTGMSDYWFLIVDIVVVG